MSGSNERLQGVIAALLKDTWDESFAHTVPLARWDELDWAPQILAAELSSHPFFVIHRPMRLGGVTEGLTSYDVANAMIRVARRSGHARHALELLQKLAKTRNASVQAVLVVGGVVCTEIERITDRISLFPYERLPECFPKAELSKQFLFDARPRFHVDPKLEGNCAALVLSAEFSDYRVEQADAPDLDGAVLIEELQVVCRLFGANDEYVPFELGSWLFYSDPDIQQFVKHGGMLAGRLPLPYLSQWPPRFQKRVSARVVSQWLEGYLALPTKHKTSPDRPRVKLALERFVRAKMHNWNGADWQDGAIDLAIAFEVLLLPEDSQAELNFRLLLRASRLLERELEPRKNRWNWLKALYKARSDIVHGGAPHAKYPVRPKTPGKADEGFPLSVVLRINAAQFARLVRLVLTVHPFPDWSVIELSENFEVAGGVMS